jgi:3-oxoacyl-[acyl-carrier-protein] synthase-3
MADNRRHCEARMAKGETAGIRIAGIASAVPAQVNGLENLEFIPPEQALKISENVGVRTRRIAPPSICASDLCYAAAARLMRELDWAPGEITGLIFITQTPDYVLPATSHALHARLGLPVSCYAFDINLGCSGFVYGLWIATSLMQNVKGKTLLLVGDTSSHIISPRDQSVAPLFGDAGSATALEPSADAAPMYFELGADGSGVKSLIVPAGGGRRPSDASTGVRTLREGQNFRSDEDLFMDGAEVFTFSLQRVPGLVKAILGSAGCGIDGIDSVVFHQANRFMLEYLAKRIKIPPEKFALALENFGNTSSASIPMAITTTALRERLQNSTARLLLAGFGVGFSWAATVLQCGPGAFPELVECDESIAATVA